MVYGQFGSVFGKWYQAFDDPDDMCLDNSLAAKFSEKANTKDQGLTNLTSWSAADITCTILIHADIAT